jgi:two-component system, chemotaxis family, CheB/CheR fusion protein
MSSPSCRVLEWDIAKGCGRYVACPIRRPRGQGSDCCEWSQIWIARNTAVTLALAFHELATNATKYGSLSNEVGQVQITWKTEPETERREIRLHWRRPPAHSSTGKGFGSLLVERVLAYEAQGRTKLSSPASGLEFDFQLPLSDKVKLM